MDFHELMVTMANNKTKFIGGTAYSCDLNVKEKFDLDKDWVKIGQDDESGAYYNRVENAVLEWEFFRMTIFVFENEIGLNGMIRELKVYYKEKKEREGLLRQFQELLRLK